MAEDYELHEEEQKPYQDYEDTPWTSEEVDQEYEKMGEDDDTPVNENPRYS
jgi:hypothetical protein